MYVTRYLNSYDLDERHALLVNGLSGAVDVITRADLEWLDRPDALAERADKAELVDQLRRRGYLFDAPGDEDAVFNNLRAVYEHLRDSYKQRFSFVFNPTYMCNFGCPYCFESREMHTTRSVMTERQVELCFDATHAILEQRVPGGEKSFKGQKRIELFGGEPLLPVARPAVEAIFARAAAEGFAITVISNGYAIHRSRDLLERYQGIIDHFQITVDGPKRIHDTRRVLLGGGGTFDRIMENIQMLLDLDLNVAVRMNTDRINIETIPEILQLFKDRGWFLNEKFFWDLAPVTDHTHSGDVPDMLQEHEIIERMQAMFGDANKMPTNFNMFRILRHVLRTLGLFEHPKEDGLPSCHYCEANIFQFYCFGPDGLIYACPESINRPELAIGRFDPDFEIDQARLEPWGRNIFNSPKCKECSIATFCGGGCAIASQLTHPDTGLPVCDDAQAVLATYIESVKDRILEAHCAS